MQIIIDICLIPIGVGVSVSKYVAECQKVLEESGLKYQLHSFGTGVEGEWDDVMAAVKICHERIHGMGAPRIVTNMKVGTRIDRHQSMTDKIESVKGKL